MTVMESGSEILKVDEVDRVRTPLEEREAMLAEYEWSGMTGAQFARFVGARYSSLTLIPRPHSRSAQVKSMHQHQRSWRQTDEPRVCRPYISINKGSAGAPPVHFESAV